MIRSSDHETDTTASPPQPTGHAPAWPLEVRCLFEALTRPAPVQEERRSRKRTSFRVQTRLWFTTEKGESPVDVYLRDYDDRGVAFVTPVHVPVGATVELELPLKEGGIRRIGCRVGRCRQFLQGWFEGVLHSSGHRAHHC